MRTAGSDDATMVICVLPEDRAAYLFEQVTRHGVVLPASDGSLRITHWTCSEGGDQEPLPFTDD
jgi:hypothetical protein